MGTRTKVILCLLLTLFAAASLLAVLASLGVLDGTEPEDGETPAYALRTWQGRVAVFCPPEADEPQAVTDIRPHLLPLPDRLALVRGMAAADRDSAVRLLEDLSA